LTRRQVREPRYRSQNTRTETFRFTADQYGHLWLHAKLEGIEVGIDLGEKEQAGDGISHG
jgi:hypothetical protein